MSTLWDKDFSCEAIGVLTPEQFYARDIGGKISRLSSLEQETVNHFAREILSSRGLCKQLGINYTDPQECYKAQYASYLAVSNGTDIGIFTQTTINRDTLPDALATHHMSLTH